MSVKITIPTYLATLLAPHTCCGCNITGTLLCDNCKNDIIRDPLYRCLECGQPTLVWPSVKPALCPMRPRGAPCSVKARWSD